MSIPRWFVLSGLFLAAPVPLVGQTLTPRQIAERARPALVYVEALSGGTVAGTGSGVFVAANGTFITNFHVIEDADALRVRIHTGEVFDNLYLVSTDERHDLAILRVPATNVSFLPIGDDRLLGTGDPVWAMGNPLGLEGTFSDGLVSAKRLEDGVQYLQITAPISPGSSGGPVLNARAEVVGIATLSLRTGQNLNMAVPARYASGLLALAGTPRPFARVSATRPAPVSTATTAAEDTSSLLSAEWTRAVVGYMARVTAEFEQAGWRRFEGPEVDALNQSASRVFTFDLVPGSFAFAGVCDDDCADLDLALRDPRGTLITSDNKTNSFPVVATRVTVRGRYRLTVSMYACTVEPCLFAVQPFRK